MIKRTRSPRAVRRARIAITAHHRNDTVVHGPPAHDTARAPGRLIRGRTGLSRLGVVIGGLLVGLVGSLPVAQADIVIPPPGPLSSIPPVVQEKISGLALVPNFVNDVDAAVKLGKSLFWDIQAGSDGQACASCHYHAGADNRIKNQLSPGLLGGNAVFDPTGSDGAIGPNYKLARGDYPFHKLVDPGNNDSFVEFDTDDVTSSAGVSPSIFKDIVLGDAFDDCYVEGAYAGGDTVGFQVNGINVRRVEPRNTPTVINAVFNHRNFWDGRANNLFNGVDPTGRHNPDARIFEVQDANVVGIKVEFENSSLASQAVGPALSHFEMSCGGRSFAKLGKKMLSLMPLGSQLVHPNDSVLGALSNSSFPGLSTTYQAMIEDAFPERFWQSGAVFDASGNEIDSGSLGDTNEYTQTEINFSFFWGMAIQLYETTLVSNQSPFDRRILTEQQQQGFDLFMGQGKCVLCHSTAIFTSASTIHITPRERIPEGLELVERMLGGTKPGAPPCMTMVTTTLASGRPLRIRAWAAPPRLRGSISSTCWGTTGPIRSRKNKPVALDLRFHST